MTKKDKEISSEEKLDQIIKEKKKKNDILKKLLKEIEKTNNSTN
jgi:hypothetical protein